MNFDSNPGISEGIGLAQPPNLSRLASMAILYMYYRVYSDSPLTNQILFLYSVPVAIITSTALGKTLSDSPRTDPTKL